MIAATAGPIDGGCFGAPDLPQKWLDAVETGEVELEVGGQRSVYKHGRDRLVELADELSPLAERGGLKAGARRASVR